MIKIIKIKWKSVVAESNMSYKMVYSFQIVFDDIQCYAITSMIKVKSNCIGGGNHEPE